MPWTVDEVDKFKRGLDEAGKKRWVAIANGTLAECLEGEDADELDCEVRAIRVANATVDGKEKAAALALADKPNPLRPIDGETINVALAEPTESEYQLAFPIGLFKTGKYGEMIITRTFAERMVENWSRKVLGERSVFMDVNHDFDQAAAWARDMRVSDNGLEVAWDFNELGRELISDRRYRYYSAAIGGAVDLETGDLAYPVLHAVSLTNTPVMNAMPEAHLSDAVDSPAHGDGKKHNEEESMNTLAEIKEALFALSDDERGELTDTDRARIADALGLELADPKRIEEIESKATAAQDKLEVVLSENRDMAEELNTYREAKRKADRDTVINAATEEGKILPKNRERWERLYDADPEGTAQILSEKGKEIEYTKQGTARTVEVVLSDVELRAAKDAGMEPAEYRALMADVFGEEEEK